MIVVPRWFSFGIASLVAVYAAAFAVITIATGAAPLSQLIALGFFGAAFGLCVVRTGRASLAVTIAVLGLGLALPILGSVGLDPVRDSYSSGAWFLSGVGCLVVMLIWRQRPVVAWILLGGLVLHTYAWGGIDALNSIGVIAAVLLIAVIAAGGWAVARTEHHLRSFSDAERGALEWQAAQDAYQVERQGRLATTSRLSAAMLERIAGATEGLTDADARSAACSSRRSATRSAVAAS